MNKFTVDLCREDGGPNFCLADLGVAIYEALDYTGVRNKYLGPS